MRIEHRTALESDDASIIDGYIVRTGTKTVIYDSYEQVKWALQNPVLRDRYKIVHFDNPILTRHVFEEKK